MFPDTYEYIYAANLIADFKIHISRVPVYPIFIQLAHKLLPWLEMEASAVILQIILAAVASILLFFTCRSILKSNIKALIVVLFYNISISVINWDTFVLTESTSLIFIICMLASISAYFIKKQPRYIIITFASCFLLVFTKPFYLLLPILISGILLVFNLINNKSGKAFTAVVCSAVFIYIAVFGYCFLNQKQNDYFGISNVSVINRLGKVFQYDMYDLGSNEKIKTYIEKEYELSGGEDPVPVVFIAKYGLAVNNYEEISEFVDEVIKEHPFIYLRKTMSFVTDELYRYPFMTDYNLSWTNYSKGWPEKMYYYFNDMRILNNFSFVFLLIFIESIIILWRILRKTKIDWIWIFCVLMITYQLFMSVFGAHGEYPRLMAPVYILIFLVFFRLLFDVLTIMSPMRRVNRLIGHTKSIFNTFL